MKSLFAYLLIATLLLSYTAIQAQQLTYKKTYTTTDGLLTNTVSAIEKDVNGFYWFKSIHGFTRFDGKHFVQYPINAIPTLPLDSCLQDYQSAHFILTKPVSIVFVTRGSKVVKAINSNNIFFSNLYNKKLNKNTRVDIIHNKNPRSLENIFSKLCTSNDINHLTVDEHHSYTVDTKGTVFYIVDGKIQTIHKKDANYFTHFLLHDSLVLVNPYKWEYVLIKQQQVITSGHILFEQIPQSISSINFEQQLSNYRLLLIGNTIYKASLNKQQLDILPFFKIPNTVDAISFFFDERKKQLLIGTQKNGIIIYDFTRFTIHTIEASNNIFYSQALTHKGLVTNQDIYLKVLKQYYPTWSWANTGIINELPNHQIVTSEGRSLYMLNNGLKTVQKIELENINYVGGVFNSFTNTDSVVYLTAASFLAYHIKKGQLKKFDYEGWPTYGKPLDVIALSPHPHCLYAGIDGELRELNTHTQRSTTIAKGFTGEIRHIYYDSSTQLIFVSVRNNGCYCVLPNGSITKLPAGTSGKFTTCHYVLQDKQGDYWLPTNNGLYCLFKKDLLAYIHKQVTNVTYKFWDKNDGIVNDEFNGGFTGSGILIGDSISLCSMEGRVVFHPNIKYEVQKETGHLIIDAIQVDTTNLATNNTAITLPPNFRQLNITVAYPFITNSSGMIEYRLLGTNDTAWHAVNDNGIIEVKNLQAGKYTLGIKVGNSPSNTKTIAIEVLPHWYNTWWMYSLYALLLAISLYVLFSWRLLQVKNKQLAQLEKTKSQLFTTIAHDLKSPINNFTTLSDTMQFLIAEKDFDTIAAIGADMDKKSKNLTLLLSNILDWSLDEQAINNNNTTTINLQLLLATILPPYKDIAANKQVTLINQIAQQITITTNEQALSTILRNLVDNAIKNAVNNSLVNIYAQQNDNSIYLQVSNAASNTAIPKLQTIQAMLAQAKPIVPLADGVGLGLALVHNNVVKLGGNIKIGINQQTVTFYVELPSVG